MVWTIHYAEFSFLKGLQLCSKDPWETYPSFNCPEDPTGTSQRDLKDDCFANFYFTLHPLSLLHPFIFVSYVSYLLGDELCIDGRARYRAMHHVTRGKLKAVDLELAMIFAIQWRFNSLVKCNVRYNFHFRIF